MQCILPITVRFVAFCSVNEHSLVCTLQDSIIVCYLAAIACLEKVDVHLYTSFFNILLIALNRVA